VVAATVILALTVAAIVARPRGLGEGWSATLGATAMLLTRLATPGDLLAVVREVAGVLLFLLGMMVLTAAAERAGLFALLARRTALAARGSGRALYAGLFFLGAAVTAFLSLDVTVLVLTPIVHALAVRLRLKPLPYLFICTFVANTGSLLPPISNLTNLLVYGLLGLSFTGFARAMLLPQLAALAANLAVLALLFRRDIPRRFDPAPLRADPPVDDPAYLRAATLVLGATLVALVVAGVRGWPIAAPALAGGAALAGAALARGRATPRALAAEVSWGLFPFVVGMFTIIRGVEDLWLRRLGGTITLTAHDLPALLVAAGGTALGSNLVNNVPMVAALIGVLRQADPAAREPLALAVVLGGNRGPVVTPFGSLATLLWLAIVRRKGEAITGAGYMKVGALVAPPVLLAATLALWAVLR